MNLLQISSHAAILLLSGLLLTQTLLCVARLSEEEWGFSITSSGSHGPLCPVVLEAFRNPKTTHNGAPPKNFSSAAERDEFTLSGRIPAAYFYGMTFLDIFSRGQRG